MCGIAGLIHRGKSSNVGHELQGMLQALKHRGEDSTGYALYGDTDGKNFIMRFKLVKTLVKEVRQLLRMCLYMMKERKLLIVILQRWVQKLLKKKEYSLTH